MVVHCQRGHSHNKYQCGFRKTGFRMLHGEDIARTVRAKDNCLYWTIQYIRRTMNATV